MAAKEKDFPTLVDEIRNYNTKKLIKFLRREKDLRLENNDLEIIRNERVNGRTFLKMTEKKLRNIGLYLEPAIKLADFIKECKKKKKRAFSQKDLKDVLSKYGVKDGLITSLPQFTPEPYYIDDKNEALLHCLEEIRLRLHNMGPVVECDGAIRCEYISAILHACIHIVRKHTGKKISLNPQFEVVGKESTGRVDYAIKTLDELICITLGKPYQIGIGFAQNLMQCENVFQTNKEQKADDASNSNEEYDYLFGIVTTATDWYFLLYTSDGISCTSRNPLSIHFLESALKEGSEKEKELHKSVKCVIEVIVGLLMKRVVGIEKEPSKKRKRVE